MQASLGLSVGNKGVTRPSPPGMHGMGEPSLAADTLQQGVTSYTLLGGPSGSIPARAG